MSPQDGRKYINDIKLRNANLQYLFPPPFSHMFEQHLTLPIVTEITDVFCSGSKIELTNIIYLFIYLFITIFFLLLLNQW